ncbi:uncharacterized protein LOC123268153 isoform X2 [Cotesia glomerata]|uniref:Uncharacterized protein n=1 Tax=Cotesia glomerata TaxID=32391 RepID=A0AAV7HUW0_COTGL|nr:uncharacterized protein LOC123268153 isoform X2 [Cotesia glomerata]KAH0534537.1 hypothetical protein KQX54_004955 [Cotesia glomerata]
MVSAKIITISAFVIANAICSGAFPQYFPNQMPNPGYQYQNNWPQYYPVYNQDNYSPIYPQPIDPPDSNQGYQNFRNPGFSYRHPSIPGNVRHIGPITTVRKYSRPISTPAHTDEYFGGAIKVEHGPSNGWEEGSEQTTITRTEYGPGRRR